MSYERRVSKHKFNENRSRRFKKKKTQTYKYTFIITFRRVIEMYLFFEEPMSLLD